MQEFLRIITSFAALTPKKFGVAFIKPVPTCHILPIPLLSVRTSSLTSRLCLLVSLSSPLPWSYPILTYLCPAALEAAYTCEDAWEANLEARCGQRCCDP